METSDVSTMNDLRLGAARRRLAECSGQSEAIEAVREIVSNFLGCEEMALFHADCQNVEFRTFWSFGIEPEKCNLLWTLNDKGLERILRGECHVEAGANAGNDAKRVRAFVPIRVANDTIAVLAILQLLPQKAGFSKADMELLMLLSTEAGKALFHPGAQGVNHASNEPEYRA